MSKEEEGTARVMQLKGRRQAQATSGRQYERREGGGCAGEGKEGVVRAKRRRGLCGRRGGGGWRGRGVKGKREEEANMGAAQADGSGEGEPV